MINQDIIAQDLFYKIRSRFPKMEMGDENGAPTFEATKGRFFDFDAVFEGVNLGTVSISINEPGSLKIYFNRNILEDADQVVSQTWYNFLKEMRKFAMKRLMSFDTRDISKTNLDKRDYGYLAKKESVMSESIMKGTSRTSYKPLEKTRLIIRHSKPVDESIPGSRSRNIESLFIENAAGERFKYPFPHKSGAEAMQRHVANGGVPHDPIGQKIIEMSSDIAKLTSFKRYVTREDLMNAGTNDIVERANAKLLSLKETIHKLSRQHYYEEFKAACATGTEQDAPLIDEYTMEDYKDKFTVKNFKEDIADVFPLLYRIMQETQEIDLAEVTKEQDQTPEIDLDSVVAESPEFQFSSWAHTLVETSLSPEELSKLKELVSEHFPVGVNGENVSATLEQLGINLSNQAKQQLAVMAETEGPDTDAKDVVIEYLSKFEPEVYTALGVNATVQENAEDGSSIPEKMAELLASGATVDSRSLGAMGHIERVEGNHITMRKLNSPGSKMRYSWLLTPKRLEGLELVQAGPNHYVLKDTDKAWGDEQQELDLGDKVRENMEQTPEERRAAAEYMAKVAQAVRSGEVAPEQIEDEFFNTLPMMGVSDEKVMAAWDRITGSNQPVKRSAMSDKDIDAELRGIDGGAEDDDAQFISNLRSKAKSGGIRQDTTGFGAEVDEGHGDQASPKKIAEFILGFYDRQKGTFPLGETGVAIKVQKEFGDKAGELAKRLIEKLSARKQDTAMFEDLKKLSGQIKTDGLTAVNKAPVKQLSEGTEFTDIQKLAGIVPGKKTETSSELLDLKALAGL